MVYVSQLKPEEFAGYRILAAGSRNMDGHDGVLGTLFPVADGFERKTVSISWKGVKRPETERFENHCLYLTRVYE
jgi:hypothetical protein